MYDCSLSATGIGRHYIWPGCLSTCFPLLQFNDYHIIMVAFVNSGYQEINPLGCKRYLIFDCHLAPVVYLGNINSISQILKRIRPAAVLCIIVMADVVSGKFIFNNRSY